jgi:hypothetical protein
MELSDIVLAKDWGYHYPQQSFHWTPNEMYGLSCAQEIVQDLSELFNPSNETFNPSQIL